MAAVIDRRVDHFHDEWPPDAGNGVQAGTEGNHDVIIALPVSLRGMRILPAGKIG